jgi:hypothetical protein
MSGRGRANEVDVQRSPTRNLPLKYHRASQSIFLVWEGSAICGWFLEAFSPGSFAMSGHLNIFDRKWNSTWLVVNETKSLIFNSLMAKSNFKPKILKFHLFSSWLLYQRGQIKKPGKISFNSLNSYEKLSVRFKDYKK